MIRKFCDSCKSEMRSANLTLEEVGLSGTEYEICGNCHAKVLNLLHLPTQSNYVNCVRNFPENQPKDSQGVET